MKPRLVLIGNGMAGNKLLEELMQSSPNMFDITVFGNEPYANYNRIMLSPLLAGEKTIDEIMLNDRYWYEANGITLNTGAENAIVAIDRAKREVVTSSGQRCAYDRLIIAIGSQPFLLPVPGCDLGGVLGFRDISDVEQMISASKQHKKALVFGAGLLGLEAAMGLMSRGMDVTVVHRNTIPLNRQLDAEAGELLQQELSSRGLHFKMGVNPTALLDTGRNGSGHVSSVQFDDGSELETDIVVMALGIRPNMRLAQQSGIYCEQGVVVTDTLQTYDPSIYALGECIQHREETFGLVAPIYDQAKVLTNHLCEHGVAEYRSLPTATKLKVTGINLFSVGDYQGNEETESLIYRDKSAGVYKKLVLRNNTLIGAVLFGDIQDGAFYNELLDTMENIEPIRPYLMFGRALCDEIKTGLTP